MIRLKDFSNGKLWYSGTIRQSFIMDGSMKDFQAGTDEIDIEASGVSLIK